MKNTAMKLVTKIEQHAIETGYTKEGRLDVARMADEYIQMSEKQIDNEEERYKKYRSIYKTFKNFFNPQKNSTLETLNKISEVLGIEDFFIEVRQVK